MRKNLCTQKAVKRIVAVLFLMKAPLRKLRKGAKKRSDMLSRIHFLICAGYSLKQAMCLVLPCGKEIYGKQAEISETLLRFGIITKSEQEFFSYTHARGRSCEAMCAFSENAHTKQMFRKKLMAAVLPSCIVGVLLIAIMIFMSVFVMPQLEPLAFQQGIKFPLALRLLLLLRDVLLYHIGSFVVFLCIAVFGLRELAFFVQRSPVSKRIFLKSFLKEYYFLQWLRLYEVVSELRMSHTLKILLPSSVVLQMPCSQNVKRLRAAEDFIKAVRTNIFFIPQELTHEFLCSRIPAKAAQEMIRKSEWDSRHESKNFMLLEYALTLAMAGIIAVVTLSLAAFMRALGRGM